MSLLKIFPHFTRSYQDALNELNRYIKSSNFYSPSSNPKLSREERNGLSSVYCSAVGIEDHHLNDLRIIHVTGSKGKGSVCSMIENVLRKSGLRTGFLSSPHLINIEERIRINGQPLSRKKFANVFWNVRDTLEEFTKTSPTVPMPSFLHYIFVMACKAFVDEKVDVGIIEVGIGGRYDHTNVFKNPFVTVITSLALEHTDVLGNTIAEIAWRKAGIFKAGSAAVVSYGQSEEAMNVLIEEAERVQCPLYIASPLDSFLTEGNMIESVKNVFDHLSMNDCRLLNLGVSLTAINLWFEKLHGNNDSCKRIGLQPTLVLKSSSTVLLDALSARWPGRWQIVTRRNITYFLDGAHTVESLQFATNWFQNQTLKTCNTGRVMRILIFTVTGMRNPKSFLQILRSCEPRFDVVVFGNPHDGQFEIPPSKESRDELCMKIWSELELEWKNKDDIMCPISKHVVSISNFINWLHQLTYFSVGAIQSYPCEYTGLKNDLNEKSNTQCCHILVTGSLYMVGRILKEICEPV
ncbi:unnamed protein product [Heterobilharzia americana]|nr:unnamed protein product [Heterobilharzia americana]